MAVKAIKYGMKGDEVSNLQTSLKNAGYNIDVDGSFGPQTLEAVKQYQAANGLTVDGMVGPQTSAVLFGGSSSTAPTISQPSTPKAENNAGGAAVPTVGTGKNKAPAASTQVNYPDEFSYGDFSYGDYAESETVMQASAALQAALAAQPGAYQSKWQSQIDDIIGRILNREDFSYDVNEDALYKQYAEQYQRGGKLAMQDTMGQAAAMTGGYGSSYASTAGNQAYQAYLSQLNEVVPELYGMALDRYNAEGQEMYNQYGLLSDAEGQDYARYMDGYNKWLAERDYAAGRYDSERDYDYGKYVDDRNYEHGVYSEDRNQAFNEYLTAIDKAQWDASFDETQKQNAIGNEQWEKSFGEEQRQYNASLAEDQRQFDTSFNESKRQYEEAKASASSGSDGSVGNNAALEHVASMSSAEIVETMQGYNADGDNTGLAAFLDDCVASGRLTEEQADAYYEKYRKGDGHIITDTTVPTKSNGSTSSGGGRGSGLAGVNNSYK